MGKPELNKQIIGAMPTWGGNFDSDVGCNHNNVANKIDSTIDSKDVTINKLNQMDVSHAKPSSKNPGVDKSFLAKSAPSMDTTGHGKLTRSCQD